jgi:molybdenum cofactor biosynthesis enzyme MoaA
LAPDEWFSVWQKIYNKYGTTSIQITGGEPSVYPRFFEVMGNVGKMHNVELQTNLSFDPKELIDNVSTEYVSRVGGSFHPQYAEFGAFLDKMVKLQEAGFKVEINYVAYPPLLKDAQARIDQAKARNVQLSILSFQGEYQGKKYPENYNEEEKVILKKLNVSSGESAEAMVDWDIEKKKIGAVEQAPTPLRVCRMGQMYTWIKPDGEAMVCCKSPQYWAILLIRPLTFWMKRAPAA